MFQSGLLATFIPEILMVLGFVLCLFTPASRVQNSSTESTVDAIEISNIEQKQNSVYQLSISTFYTTEKLVSDLNIIIPPLIVKVICITFQSPHFQSDDISFKGFSRPPPSFHF